MLVVGTKPEYFNAVWVKNEWSRYLKLLKTDRSRLIIPCYRDMDAYDLPDEFAHLQSQDMSKIGFVNDVVRGIKKVIIPETDQQKETIIYQTPHYQQQVKEEIPFKTQENNNKKGFSKFKLYLLLSAIALIVAEIIVLFEVFIGF